MSADLHPVIYGKHPAFGDFLSHGLSRDMRDQLDAWLNTCLQDMKTGLARNWTATWSVASPLYIWFGPQVLGTPLTGLFLPSRDKVGRLFPLILGVTGCQTPAPTSPDRDPALLEALWAHVVGFRLPETGVSRAADLLEGLDLSAWAHLAGTDIPDGTIWADRDDGDYAQLFAAAAAPDIDRAQMTRSHWWRVAQPDRTAGWLATEGLPDWKSLHWVLTSGRDTTTTGLQETPIGEH